MYLVVYISGARIGWNHASRRLCGCACAPAFHTVLHRQECSEKISLLKQLLIYNFFTPSFIIPDLSLNTK